MRHDAVTPGARFVLAHGFTQTARSWSTFEPLLAERIPGADIVAVDLPGHGDSTAPPTADLWASAEHLVATGGPATYVGYSMGGRVALHAAISHPDDVQALVLIGATAGIESVDERAARRAADEGLAEHVDQVGVATFIDEWLANPLFAGLTDATAQRDDRLRNTATGLATSLRSTGTGTQESLWGRLGEVTCPVLILVGERDEKFTALGRRLAAGLPDATMTVVADAGHSVHLEQPVSTADAVASWHHTRP